MRTFIFDQVGNILIYSISNSNYISGVTQAKVKEDRVNEHRKGAMSSDDQTTQLPFQTRKLNTQQNIQQEQCTQQFLRVDCQIRFE